MAKYILGRVIRALFTIWGVVTIVFVIPRTVGDPAAVMAPMDAGPEAIEAVRQNLGLDKPIIVQYGLYLKDILHGDLGNSYLFHAPAVKIVANRFPATLQLASASMLWAVAFGISLGMWAALKKGTLMDHVTRTAAVLGQSMPPYWTAILLVLFFAVRYHFFPITPPDGRFGTFHELVLPSVALGWFATGPIARLTRSAMLDVLDHNYIAMARMKGLPERVVLVKHALRNAVIPVMTFASLQFGRLLGGAVVVEAVFAWPGLGTTVLMGIFNWDFPLVQVTVILGSSIFVAINLLVDLLYGVVDPRVRLA